MGSAGAGILKRKLGVRTAKASGAQGRPEESDGVNVYRNRDRKAGSTGKLTRKSFIAQEKLRTRRMRIAEMRHRKLAAFSSKSDADSQATTVGQVLDDVDPRLREQIVSGGDVSIAQRKALDKLLASWSAEGSESPRLAEAVGGCFTGKGFRRELGMTRSELESKISKRLVLRLVTRDQKAVYPAFQVRNGDLVPGLDLVLQELVKGVNDPWTWAQWLNAQSSEASLDRHIDDLVEGDIDTVVSAARRAAAAWTA